MLIRRSIFPTLLFLTFFPGYVLSAVVTLTNVKFYSAHKWTGRKPEVYFKCSGENQTFLPDVKKANVLYSFNGEESWQPLTELRNKKCKRCGIYEDHLMSHHIFDEWELCSSDFSGGDGHHSHFKEKEFNATFLCEDCLLLTSDSPRMKEGSKSSGGGKTFHIVTFLVTIGVVAIASIGLVLLFKYWQRRKRQRQQARFLKLFEDDDEMEAELGLREMI